MPTHSCRLTLNVIIRKCSPGQQTQFAGSGNTVFGCGFSYCDVQLCQCGTGRAPPTATAPAGRRRRGPGPGPGGSPLRLLTRV